MNDHADQDMTSATQAPAPAAITATNNSAVAAFFDVDNTLMRGSSMYHFAIGLARRRYFSPRELAEVAWKHAKFTITGKEHLGDVAAIIEQAQSLVAGKPVADIVALGEEIYAERMANNLGSPHLSVPLSALAGWLSAPHYVVR